MTVKPALTAEEWAEVLECAFVEGMVAGAVYGADMADIGRPKERHALAALCLHNQPFGFTRGDVRYLRACADIVGEVQGGHYHTEEGELHRIADRIEALLPPEDK